MTPIQAAADLLGPDADTEANPEYLRALVEMTCLLLGVSTEERETVEYLIRRNV